jgi:dihydroneopterin aldolase
MKNSGQIDYDKMIRLIQNSGVPNVQPNQTNFTYVQFNYNDLVNKLNDKLSGKQSFIEQKARVSVSAPKPKKPKKEKKVKVEKQKEYDLATIGKQLALKLNCEANELQDELNYLAEQKYQMKGAIESEAQNTRLLEDMRSTLSDISFRQYKELVNKSKGK